MMNRLPLLYIGLLIYPYTSLIISEGVNEISTCDMDLPGVKDLTAFDDLSIEVSGVELFGGRIGNPSHRIDVNGSNNVLKGYDHTVKLMDYDTPYVNLEDENTNTIISTLLTYTPYTYSIEDSFGYDSPLMFLNEWEDFMNYIETWDNTTLELDLSLTNKTTTIQLDYGTGPQVGARNNFYYGGDTPRYYIFWSASGVGTRLSYYFSEDGDTWDVIDSGIDSFAYGWGVAWNNDKVYLFTENTATHVTEFRRGTINDVTGVITFALINANVFAGADAMMFGPIWDDQGDMWVISDVSVAWESTNDGLNWNNVFSPVAGLDVIFIILPEGTDGDLIVIGADTTNSDWEEWLWDRSAGTLTFVAKIDNTGGFFLYAEGCSDADYNPYIVLQRWASGTGGYTRYADKLSGSWVVHNLTTGYNTEATISCDGYRNAYLGWAVYPQLPNFYVAKFSNGVQEHFGALENVYASSVSSPRTYLQDGHVGIFFATSSLGEKVPSACNYVSFAIKGMRLIEGAATGSFTTRTISSSAPIQKWGGLVANGENAAGTDWSILQDVTLNVLVDNQNHAFDIDRAGVPITETDILAKCDLTSTNPSWINKLLITEVIDAFTIQSDHDNVYVGLDKWRKLSGGEFYLDGSDMLHLVSTIGEDKSGIVVLKNGLCNLYPDISPNIVAAETTIDWDSYANCVRVLGVGVPPLRAEAALIYQDEVDIYGEKWAVIRDGDLESSAMALTRAKEYLDAHSTVIRRVSVNFIDTYDPNIISIGDTITLAITYNGLDGSTVTIDTPARILKLTRSYSVNGSTASAELITETKDREFIDYLKSVDNALRWVMR